MFTSRLTDSLRRPSDWDSQGGTGLGCFALQVAVAVAVAVAAVAVTGAVAVAVAVAVAGAVTETLRCSRGGRKAEEGGRVSGRGGPGPS